MEQQSKWRLLSKRNILGAVLVAGIGAGLYLGDIWKGFGGGNSLGIGAGDGNSNSTSVSTSTDVDTETHTNIKGAIHDDHTEIPAQTAAVSVNAPEVVKVVIADRSYFVRSADGDKVIDLKQLVSLVKSAPGDHDGIHIRVYRKQNSRTTTELALRDALVEAGINEDQIVWIATPIE